MPKPRAAHPPTWTPDTAALFPDRFGDDGLPDGWELKRVDDCLELAYGKSLPKKDRKPGSVPVYGSGGETGFHNEFLAEGPTIIVGRKGTVGSLYWEDRPSYPIDNGFLCKAAGSADVFAFICFRRWGWKT